MSHMLFRGRMVTCWCFALHSWFMRTRLLLFYFAIFFGFAVQTTFLAAYRSWSFQFYQQLWLFVLYKANIYIIYIIFKECYLIYIVLVVSLDRTRTTTGICLTRKMLCIWNFATYLFFFKGLFSIPHLEKEEMGEKELKYCQVAAKVVV